MSVTVLHSPLRAFVSILETEACAIEDRTCSVELSGL